MTDFIGESPDKLVIGDWSYNLFVPINKYE